MSKARSRKFTGYHMTAILIAFFGVVVGVNMLMARFATSTFGGIVVENSYVASQQFNGWLRDAEKQKELGWEPRISWRPDGQIVLFVDNAPDDAVVEMKAYHPLGRLPDRHIHLERQSDGSFMSQEKLPDGRWTLRYSVSADGAISRFEEDLQ
ncbi:FixH family protein [Altericroceibacterium endophyticum]|uniref:Nitrogen fixation protein FixH n=1 Tax=Altericroceibacterium endophyticum TaxID=1808508 RepID=A0A6I4T512_9SPHN|nr:FixH family protein [Altericroceibacterium endophyticum]MXO65143.1 hypothetical protein [Altericroceibacterium endophyticum]